MEAFLFDRRYTSPTMDQTERTTAEWTALNVFHDLELLYTRQERGAPEKAAAGRPEAPSTPNRNAAVGTGAGRSAFGGWRQAFCQMRVKQ